MSKVIRLEIGEEPERFFDLEEEKPSGFFERILAEKANSRIPQPGPGPPPPMDQPYRSSEGGGTGCGNRYTWIFLFYHQNAYNSLTGREPCAHLHHSNSV
jgi:hypothetical protein